MKIFDQNILETHVMELNQGAQTKTLHRNTEPPQETLGGAKNLHQALLEAKLSSHTFEKKTRELSFSKVDQIIWMLPNFIAETEGKNTAKSRDHIVPHAEEEGAFAPTRGICVAWRKNPQNLMYGDRGTIHDLHR